MSPEVPAGRTFPTCRHDGRRTCRGWRCVSSRADGCSSHVRSLRDHNRSGAIRGLFATVGFPPNFPPHYNAAPGQDLPVIRLHPETGERVLGLLRWGLIPYWSKDPKIAWRCINARGETVKTT